MPELDRQNESVLSLVVIRMINRCYKYYLRPSKTAAAQLAELLETHRRIYNEGLYYCILGYEFYGKAGSPTKKELYNYFAAKRKVDPYVAKIGSRFLHWTIRQLEQSYKNFFTRVKKGQTKAGFPKFKGKDFFNSFHSDQQTGYKLEPGGKLNISGVGDIRVKWHRELPENATMKKISIIREGKRWYLSITLEIPDAPKKCGDKKLGIDVGLKSFAALSDGRCLGDTKNLERALPELRRRQRALSRCKKGSNRRRKVVERVGALHRKVRNCRLDHRRKLATQLVDEAQLIAVEDLNIAGMVKNRHLSRRITDAGWGMFLIDLESKAAERGAKVVRVDPKYTSQACSGCGEIVAKDLSVRVHDCPHCGLKMDRDVNAANNILARAVSKKTKGRVGPSGDKRKVTSAFPKTSPQTMSSSTKGRKARQKV